MINTNNGWNIMQEEWDTIRKDSRVDADNIEYHAQQLINAYMAGLIMQQPQGSYHSCYYQSDLVINDLPVTIRVANHRGYCDASYKRSIHANTGVAAFDQALQSAPCRYIISIEVIKNRDISGSRMRVITDIEDNITRIELININSTQLLDESLSYIDTELKDLL